MGYEMEWLKYLMLFGGIQGMVLTLALLGIKSPNGILNKLFAFIALSVSINLIVHANGTFIVSFPRVYLLSFSFIFCYTPVFFLFIRALAKDSSNLNKSDALLFLPLFVYLIALLPWLGLETKELVRKIFSELGQKMYWVDCFGIAINGYLLFKSYKILHRNSHTWNTNQISSLHAFWGMIALSNITWLIAILPRFGFFQLSFPLYIINWITTSFLIFFFVYFIVLRSEFFNAGKKEKYQQVSLSSSDIEKLGQHIISTIVDNKAYKNPDFSLKDLATLSGIEKYKLSLVLNKGLKSNFFDLINTYRVEEYIALTKSGEFKNYSMFGVANEAGFKSKSTFYKAFKKSKGVSPKHFFS